MKTYPFGNDPEKIGRYRAFWDRSAVERPLAGFTRVGWFPLSEFTACRAWEGLTEVTPDMVDPRAFLPDHLRMIEEGEMIDDDLIRGAGPSSVAIPFLPGIIGSTIRLLPDNCLGTEVNLGWDKALSVRLDPENPWYRKYMEFADVLTEAADGRFPVSHGAEIGPSDIHAVLRGHTQSILDMAEDPERSAELLSRAGGLFADLTEQVWHRIPLFQGGWFDGQYSLWAPGPIARLQEDASAVFSPRLYRELVQPVDRMLSRRFPCAFMHLHSTSMFLLDAFLEIEELGCFEINNDVGGPPVETMVPFFRSVQSAGRSLLIRGSFTPAELGTLIERLDPRGLFLLIMVRTDDEIPELARVIGMR